MIKRLPFDVLWQRLEPLSDTEIDAIYAAAQSDRRYRASLYATFLMFSLIMLGIYFAIPPLFRVIGSGVALKLAIAVLVVLSNFYAFKLVARLNHRLFDQSVMRELQRRDDGNEA